MLGQVWRALRRLKVHWLGKLIGAGSLVLMFWIDIVIAGLWQ